MFSDNLRRVQMYLDQVIGTKVIGFRLDWFFTPVAECSCVCTSMSTADSGAGS